MNTIMDVFGKNIKVTKADDDLLLKYLGNNVEFYEKQGIIWLKVSVETTTGGVELWVTQYCKDCFVVSPEELRISVKERLEIGLDYYNKL